MGVCQVPVTTGAGASSTGRFCAPLAARESRAASRATLATPSVVSTLVAAKPHAPFTSVRTPMPYDSPSDTPVIWRSRVLMFWLR
jgi:hypothetical protein